MVYGLEVRPYHGEARSVIGEVDVSLAGNVVLRVGREHSAGWEQTEHVALTPGEARDVAYEMLRKLDTNGSSGDLVLNPGTILPNGAIVIQASARKEHVWFILALRPGSHANDAYVTWECNRPGDATDTRWGHYFDSLPKAYEDFLTRGV